MKINEFASKGFISVPYPSVLRRAVKEAEETWKAFCSLPPEVKRSFPYSNEGAGAGYEDKTIKAGSRDRKENFDLSISDMLWLREQAQRINEPLITTFIDSLGRVVECIAPSIASFASEVEDGFEVVGFGQEVADGSDRYFIRFIHYFPVVESDVETAEAHTDQSGMTAHLFESAPGFQYLNLATKKWEDMPILEGKMLIIPAMQLQLRSEGKLTALCHRVISNVETVRTGRYSAVCFVQFRNTSKYNKDKGRLQDLHAAHPGFNYRMPLQEFRTYFK